MTRLTSKRTRTEAAIPEQVTWTVDPPELTRRAKKQAKQAAKAEGKAAKDSAKAEKMAAQAEKANVKASMKADKREAKAAHKGEHGRVTPSNAKKYLGVAKVVGPAIAPFALKAASGAREGYDRMRARQLGIPVDDLGRYSGKGAALHARIAGVANALDDLRSGTASRNDERAVATEQFVEAAERRMEQLTSAVRAAERMPTARRRAAHRAVSGELNRIEDDLLQKLGI